jgi:hypothetical protein
MQIGIGTGITFPRPAIGGAAWSPLSLGSLVAWWEISQESTITQASGTASVVPDRSTNNLNLVQTAIPGDQPATGGTIGTNSIHALTFGGQDFMSVAHTLAQPFTFSTIAQSTATGVIQALFSFNASSVGEELGIWNSNQYRMDAGSPQLFGSADTNAHVWVAEFNGATSRLYIDGTLIATVNAGTNGATIFRLGVRQNGFLGWQGTVSDTVVAGAVLSSGDRASLTTYLGDLAGITVT